MSTTNFGQGHAAQAQEAPVRGSGDGYRLRSRSVDASAKVGNRRPTPVRYPKGQESTLDTEIELRNVTLAKTTNLTLVPITIDENENLTYIPQLSHLQNVLPVTTSLKPKFHPDSFLRPSSSVLPHKYCIIMASLESRV